MPIDLEKLSKVLVDSGLLTSKELAEVKKKSELPGAQGNSPFAEITDDDIDNLFSD